MKSGGGPAFLKGMRMIKRTVVAAAGALLLLPAPALAQQHSRYDSPPPPADCRDHAHTPNDSCTCQHEADFYRPVQPWSVSYSGGPGIRIYGRPVLVPSGRIDIQAPPVWVDAPPIRIAAPQIYLRAPDVHVRPSEVTVEPPEIHYVGCASGGCPPAN